MKSVAPALSETEQFARNAQPTTLSRKVFALNNGTSLCNGKESASAHGSGRAQSFVDAYSSAHDR